MTEHAATDRPAGQSRTPAVTSDAAAATFPRGTDAAMRNAARILVISSVKPPMDGDRK
jgi:hypothetical protein